MKANECCKWTKVYAVIRVNINLENCVRKLRKTIRALKNAAGMLEEQTLGISSKE